MKKFSILWWIEIVGAVIFGAMLVYGLMVGSDSLLMLGILEVLIVGDIVFSLMKTEDSEI